MLLLGLEKERGTKTFGSEWMKWGITVRDIWQILICCMLSCFVSLLFFWMEVFWRWLVNKSSWPGDRRADELKSATGRPLLTFLLKHSRFPLGVNELERLEGSAIYQWAHNWAISKAKRWTLCCCCGKTSTVQSWLEKEKWLQEGWQCSALL